MTNEEAIEILNNVFQDGRTKEPIARAVFLGIKALEKQIPKKPEHYDDTEYFYIECPTCNKRFDSRFRYKDCTQRCPYCSQAVSLYGEGEANEND